jgi:hypothetical protein
MMNAQLCGTFFFDRFAGGSIVQADMRVLHSSRGVARVCRDQEKVARANAISVDKLFFERKTRKACRILLIKREGELQA